ncbi:MAG: hypothetical protein ACXWJN_08725 [Methyloceanibacter sp.]
MKTYVVAGLLLAGFVTPALAEQFYVAQDMTSHKCSIVKVKPDGKTMMMMGADGYGTKADAKKAMKGMAECKA